MERACLRNVVASMVIQTSNLCLVRLIWQYWSTRCKVWFTNFTRLSHSRVRLLNGPLTWLFKLTLTCPFAVLQQACGPVAAYRLSLTKLPSEGHLPFLSILKANMPGFLTNLKHFHMRWNRHCELESALRKPAAWPGPGTGRASKTTLIQLGVSNSYPEWPKSGVCIPVRSEDSHFQREPTHL